MSSDLSLNTTCIVNGVKRENFERKTPSFQWERGFKKRHDTLSITNRINVRQIV